MIRAMRAVSLTTAALLLAVSAAFALTATAQIEPARVRTGEAATLSVTIDGGDAPEPVSVPEVEGLAIAFTGTRRSFQFVNGKSHSETALTFSVVPQRSGSFTIPPVTLKRGAGTIRSNAVMLLAYEGSGRSAHGAGPVAGLVRASKTKVLAGEPILLRLYIVHSGIDVNRAPALDAMPAAKGFLLKQVDEALPEESVHSDSGDYIRTHIATFAAVPLESGRFAIGGGSVSVSVAESAPDSFFPFMVPTTRRVNFDTVPVVVNLLPAEGRPADFRGDVGAFSLKAEFPAGKSAAFMERRLTLKIAGRGNLLSLRRPEFAKVDGLTIIGSDGAAQISAAEGSLEGEREFIYTIIPQRPGSFLLPGLRLSYFNPASGRYETARTTDQVFEASPGARTHKESGPDDANRPPGLEFDPLPVLSIMLLAAAGAAAAVWWRRRGSIVRRQEDPPAEAPAPARSKDRRAELANAARRRDADLFLKTAGLVLDEARDAVWYKRADDSLRERVNDLKQRVDLHRYAGRALSDGEMDELYRRFREVFR